MKFAKLYIDSFDGIVPILSPKLLADRCAQTAQNCYLSPKNMKPWKIPLGVQGAPGNTTIYPWRRNGGTQWLGWNTDVDVVQSPVAEDQYERIYYTGDGTPKVKGWDGGEVTKEMAQPVASTPTAAAVKLLSDDAIAASSLTLYGYVNNGSTEWTSGGWPLTAAYVSHERIGMQIKIKFRWQYRQSWGFASLFFYQQLAFAGAAAVPASHDKSTLLGKTITLSGIGVATITKFEDAVLQHDPMYPASYDDIWEATVTLDMDYGDGNNSTRYCYYVQTLVNEWGMEGPPSGISNQVTWNPGDKVVLTDFGSAASDTTKRRFYRSAAGEAEDNFFFLGEVDVGDSSYDDTKTDAQLAETLTLFENPPTGLTGLVMMPGGWAAGFVGRQVCFTPPYYPWSWPTEYRVTVDFDVIGLGVAGNDLYVMTKGNPYLVTGYHPESLTVSKIAVAQSCVSKRSIVTMDRTILYASPDGVQSLAGGSGALVTDKFYGRTEWQAISPSTIIGGVNDRRYFCFHSTGGIIFKFADGADTCTTTDQVTTGLYSDLLDDTLYMIQSGNITAWNRGASNTTMLWKSKEFASNRRENWNSARIFAEVYPVTLRMYGDGNLMTTITVADQTSFRLPKMQPYRTWSFSVEATGYIDFVAIGTSMSEII